MDFGPFGFSEILFIGVLALVVFGPRRLPEIGQAAGRAAAKLKRATAELRQAYESELDEESREQIASARRGLTEVKDTIQAAGRELWGEGDRASQAARAAGQDAQRAVTGAGAVTTGGAAAAAPAPAPGPPTVPSAPDPAPADVRHE